MTKTIEETCEHFNIDPAEFRALMEGPEWVEALLDAGLTEEMAVLQDIIVSSLAMGGLSGHPDIENPTAWQEANALMHTALRNGPLLENLHAGRHEPITEDPDVSLISQAQMRALMIFTTRRLALFLTLKDFAPTVYKRMIQGLLKFEAGRWIHTDDEAKDVVPLGQAQDDGRIEETIDRMSKSHGFPQRTYPAEG